MIHIHRTSSLVAGIISIFLPAIAMAQTGANTQAPSIDKLGAFLFQFIFFIDNYLVPALFAVAFIVFIFGIFQYFIAGGANEEKRDTGKKFMLWGFIGFFIMVTVWGIVNLLVNSSGLGRDTRPDLPTFGNPYNTQTQTGNGSAFPTAAGTQNTVATPATVREGDRGQVVKNLQQQLGITADGIFGPQTKNAVIQYQKANGLTPDGIVGPQTWGSLSGASSATANKCAYTACALNYSCNPRTGGCEPSQ